MRTKRHAIFLGGPIGVGKTSLGQALAQRLGWSFLDGDDFSVQGRPWYCSIHATSKAIVREGLSALDHHPALVIAYPLGCVNWIYFKRCFGDTGVVPHFITLRASYSSIVSAGRGRLFSDQEQVRIKKMIEEGYSERRFSDEVIDTDHADFPATLDVLERCVRGRTAC